MHNRAIPLLLVIALLVAGMPAGAAAQDSDEPFCVFFFSSVGCSHCARVDPLLFGEWLHSTPGLVVVDYELSSDTQNAAVFDIFVERFGIPWGVPVLVYAEDGALQGDRPIISGGPDALENATASQTTFFLQDLNFTEFGGTPRIWHGDRVLIREGAGGDEAFLRGILFADNINTELCGHPFEIVDPVPVQHSSESMEFEHAVRVEGWLVQWNGEDLTVEPCGRATGTDGSCDVTAVCLTLPKIISLAVVDAVNPCALAVLTLMLIAILTNDPTNRRKVLSAGLAFTLAIFIFYLLYGIAIVKLFQVIQALASLRIALYTALGAVAIVLGLLQLKDFFRVGKKGLLTTMPKPLRPVVTSLIAGITSVPGSFIVGALVSIFLLPCTIGPYIIAGGILSVLDIVATLPYLLLYNLVFVVPMFAIIAFVYLGYARIEDVSGWREENIRYLHGIAGAIMFLLGIGMVLGLI